jgi:hypothetical protein
MNHAVIDTGGSPVAHIRRHLAQCLWPHRWVNRTIPATTERTKG